MSFARNPDTWPAPRTVTRVLYSTLLLNIAAFVLLIIYGALYLMLVPMAVTVFVFFGGLIIAPFTFIRTTVMFGLWFIGIVCFAAALTGELPLFAVVPLACVAVLHYAVANRERWAWNAMRWFVRLGCAAFVGLCLLLALGAQNRILALQILADALEGSRFLYGYGAIVAAYSALTLPRVFDLTIYNAWPYGEPAENYKHLSILRFNRKGA